MPFNPLHGKDASVLIGIVEYAFDEWSVTMRNKLGEVSNFTGGGYRQFVKGLSDGKINLSGPYDKGNMPFTVGNSYTLILKYEDATDVTVTALLEEIAPTVNVDKEERVKLTFQSTGAFTAAIV
jgi:hypothetical protein